MTMTTNKAMSRTDLQAFCRLGVHVDTMDIDGTSWVRLDPPLQEHMQVSERQLGTLSIYWTAGEYREVQGTTLIAERLFHQILLASPAPAAATYRAWTSDTHLMRWYRTTGDPTFLHMAEHLRFAPRSPHGSIERAVGEYLAAGRNLEV